MASAQVKITLINHRLILALSLLAIPVHAWLEDFVIEIDPSNGGVMYEFGGKHKTLAAFRCCAWPSKGRKRSARNGVRIDARESVA